MSEGDRATVRYEVRRSLRGLVQEALHQGCLENVRRYPEVFVLFALLDPVIGEAVEQEMVTLHDMRFWLDVLLRERNGHGTAFV